MTLSDDERRVLAEMERQLTGSSADVVSTTPRRANITLVTIGVLVLVAGIGVLLAGVVLQSPIVGVVGFGVMVVGTMMTLNNKGDARPARAAKTATPRSRIADRWDRRMEGDL
jgi:hypothetical protein